MRSAAQQMAEAKTLREKGYTRVLDTGIKELRSGNSILPSGEPIVFLSIIGSDNRKYTTGYTVHGFYKLLRMLFAAAIRAHATRVFWFLRGSPSINEANNGR